MFVASNLLLAVTKLLYLVLEAYFWLIIIRALISWVSPDPYNPIVRFINRVTEPVLGPARRLLPPFSGLDLSPMIVLLAIKLVEWVVVDSLRDLAFSIK